MAKPRCTQTRRCPSPLLCKIGGVPSTCHRCSATLAPEAAFCQECGAPQLRVQPSEEDSPGNEQGAQSGHASAHPFHRVRWQSAISAAALVALPVGMLSSFLAFSTLWVMAGAVWTIALYRRWVPGRVSGTTGSRIGVVLGLFAAFISTATDAASLLIDRYGLHHGSEIDQRLHAAVQAYVDAMIASNPAAATQLPWFFRFWLSPDGHAAYSLMLTCFSAASMLGFSALGGALGARYYGRRPRPA